MPINAKKGPTLVAAPVSLKALVSFVPLPSWIKAAARCGFSINSVLGEVGIELDNSPANQVTITLEQSRRLIEACVQRAQGEHFPFIFGETFSFDSVPEIETFIATGSSLRDTMRVFDWVRELMSQALRVTLHETDDYAQLQIHMGRSSNTPGPTMYFTEAWLASVFRLTHSLLGPNQVERVMVRHAPPPHVEAYQRFFACEVVFNQPVDALVLRRESLDRPLHGAFPQLNRQAEARIAQRMSQLALRSGLAGQLERLFLDKPVLLSQGIEESAAVLGVHVRTLQRRLQEEQQSFADLQGRLRYRLACLLLKETSLDLEVISERLGFSERRAFTRAFGRWAGRSPSAYRQAPDAQIPS